MACQSSGQSIKENRISQFLDQEAKAGFTGAVLVAMEGQVLFEGAYGFADKQEGIANTVNTHFSLASLGKIFTMAAILRLIDQDRLKLEDKLIDYVKGFEDPRAEKITILDLLTHEAGWQHYWDHPEYLSARHETDSIADYMRFIKRMPLDFEPGSTRMYSNIGYIVLGAVIESVTGEDYYQHLKMSLFDPLDLKDTDFAYYKSLDTGYALHGGRGDYRYLQSAAARGASDGGGYSTIHDLYKFIQALENGSLLSENSLGRITSMFERSKPRNNWNLGLAGGFPGISTMLLHESEADATVIVLCNADPPMAPDVAWQLMQLAKD